jgi:asparagine synthase (glutamine-hydrolysing)
MFSGVQSIRAGTSVCFDANLRGHEERYWGLSLAEAHSLARLDTDAAADQLAELLENSVRLRLRSDVPVGAYLSGGLDSSVIGSLIRAVDSSPLETFSVRFTEPSFDETEEQRRVVGLLGTKHHEVMCGDKELRDAIDSVVWHCESALLRTAPVPLFILSRLVREEGMKVVLTGEGADELFAGYSIFKEDKIRRFWARQPSSALRPQLLSLVHSEVSAGAARNSELWRQFFGKGLTDVGDPCYSHRIRWDNTAWTLRVLARDLREDAGSLDPDPPPEWSEWGSLARAQWLEMETFMTPYLLAFQGDRVAMAHGVEVRYPFLDPEVVEFASHLPARLKMPGLQDKVTLRRLASRLLPDDVAMRPKVPYRAPMTTPFFGPDSGGLAADALSPEECARYELVDAKAVGRLVDKARRAHGALAGEREQMALLGAFTLQLLARSFTDSFGSRARDARDALDRLHPQVLEDRVANPDLSASASRSMGAPS